MTDRKLTFIQKKTIFRSQSIITINENGVDKLNLDDYELEKRIERTNLGSIYICKHNGTSRLFLMKVLKKKDIISSKAVERVTDEFKILSYIYHPFIIELKGVCNTNPVTLGFLFEYIPGGNLSSLIKSSKGLSIEASKFYLASLITTIDYLHKKGIVYRDLRPDNIFINSNGYIKLVDFSYMKKIDNDLTYSTCGTPEYNSPEMINKTGYNISHDFWGLGIILYEMIIGCTPFIDPDPMKIYQKINKCKVIFPKTMRNEVKMFIKGFLVADVNRRLGCTSKGIAEIIETPFFEGFDWKGLLYRTLKPPYIPVINGANDTSNYKTIEDLEEDYENDEIDKEKDPFYNW